MRKIIVCKEAWILIPLCVYLCFLGIALAHQNDNLAAQETLYSYHTLVWSDEFDGDTLDSSKWTAMLEDGLSEGYPMHWGNNEAQWYRAENVFVEDGNLVIRAKREDYGGMSYTSARITTSELFAFTYGRVEARIKLPVGYQGLWPAFWALPNGLPINWKNGGWSNSGEIDAMEAKSRTYEVSGAIHYGNTWPNNVYSAGQFVFTYADSFADWHIFTLEWFHDKMIWYIDGLEYFRVSDWYATIDGERVGPPEPFNDLFALTLNLAIGGNFDDGRLPEASFDYADMLVDWVRVYQ